jgi:hypothetical protein
MFFPPRNVLSLFMESEEDWSKSFRRHLRTFDRTNLVLVMLQVSFFFDDSDVDSAFPPELNAPSSIGTETVHWLNVKHMSDGLWAQARPDKSRPPRGIAPTRASFLNARNNFRRGSSS